MIQRRDGRAREKQKLTHSELAKRIHSSQPRVAKIEAGEEVSALTS